ncbi:hypothetical protein ACOMHN_021104 [Nucella lapillus]
MVDFRGFEHSDVEERGRGGKVGTSIGESKKAKKFLSRFERSQRLPAAARGCPFTRPAVDRFFYSLNIPKKADFRGFKHSDVPEGARGGVNKYRGV